MGEVLVQEGERLEIISRHINRAHRIMEAAVPGQILASEAVVEAGKDFINLAKEFLAIQYHGEFYLKGAGATQLCEVVDVRFRKPQPPQLCAGNKFETALLGRLELAGYRSLGRLGEGAHGVVYKVIHNGQTLALKVLNPSLCEQPAARQRFAEEAARMKQLQLPGLVRILDERLEHTPPFFAMELVEGQPVDTALAGAAPQRVAKVFERISLILARAHAAGLVHRDLKPANIFVREDDSPVLLDFGISVLQGEPEASKLSSSTLLGTPGYLAPEIIAGRSLGAAVDIYSLGVVLFKVLTGGEPFAGETVHEILQAHLHEDPPLPAAIRPEVSDGLQRICLKALEKNPADRYPSAQEMAEDFSRVASGELVRTRPSVYDNLLYHRVQKHVAQIRDWASRGLVNAEEKHRLLSVYEGLQRRGIPAVMEGRFYRFWQTLVYLGGWAVINGAVLWLVQHWNELSRTGKLLLGSVPALTTFALALAMWKLERFRLTFVALIVGNLAVPLLMGVWLHEFKVADTVPESRLKYEVFHSRPDSTELTNQQMLLMGLITLAVAGSVMWFTRTTTHSAQAMLALSLVYSTCLLWFGLKPHFEHQEWAAIALQYIPLLVLMCGVSKLLLDHSARSYQAPPWVYCGAVLLMAILYALSMFSLHEWAREMDARIQTATSYLLGSIAGGIQAAIGLLARERLRHRCRFATLALIMVGLVELLGGLGLAGGEHSWPPGWWAPLVFQNAVPAAHLALPLAALGITLLACRFQMFAFLLVGLVGFAGSIHLLGYLYFEDSYGWPRMLMMAGTGCFFGALFLELRRTRGNSIDDVVGQARL